MPTAAKGFVGIRANVQNNGDQKLTFGVLKRDEYLNANCSNA
jgi:hypothetical protein